MQPDVRFRPSSAFAGMPIARAFCSESEAVDVAVHDAVGVHGHPKRKACLVGRHAMTPLWCLRFAGNGVPDFIPPIAQG